MNTVLIVDDDPSHLKLYAWIVEGGGFRALTALAQRDWIEIPETEPVDLVVLDYRLGAQLSAVDVARRLKAIYPAAQILILSDMFAMPEDVAPYAAGFVRKGEPQELLDMITSTMCAPQKRAAN